MKKFNTKNITTILIFLFSLSAVTSFWCFIIMGNIYDNWYPLVGHFVAAHGALIASIVFFKKKQ